MYALSTNISALDKNRTPTKMLCDVAYLVSSDKSEGAFAYHFSLLDSTDAHGCWPGTRQLEDLDDLRLSNHILLPLRSQLRRKLILQGRQSEREKISSCMGLASFPGPMTIIHYVFQKAWERWINGNVHVSVTEILSKSSYLYSIVYTLSMSRSL